MIESRFSQADKVQVIADIADEMSDDGCVGAMVEMFNRADYSDQMTVIGLKEVVRQEIFSEIAANVLGEFVQSPEDFFDQQTCDLFEVRMNEAYKRVFPKFMRKIVH
jgi:predicted ATPase